MNEFAKEKVKPGKLIFARVSSYNGTVTDVCPVESIKEAEALAAEAHVENDYGTRWIVALVLVRHVSVAYSLTNNGSTGLYEVPADGSCASPFEPPLDSGSGGTSEPAPGEEMPALAQLAPDEVMRLLRNRLSLSPRSQRNYTANRCGISLGRMIRSGVFFGVLDEYEAERELVKAAIEAGLSEGEATAAIRSGINAGRNGNADGAPPPIDAGSYLVGAIRNAQ